MYRRRATIFALALLCVVAGLALLVGVTVGLLRPAEALSLPDVAIHSYIDPGENEPFAPGNEITYQIMFINESLYTAADIFIRDTLPEHTTYVSTSHPGFVLYEAGPDRVTWGRNHLLSFERGWLSVTVRVDDDVPLGIELENKVYISTEDLESNWDNNEHSIRSWVRAVEPDLRVTKHLWQNSAPLVAGNEIIYEIVAENWGGSVANSVRLTDTLPAGCAYVSDDPASSGFSTVQTGAQVVWTKASLAPAPGHSAAGASGNLYVRCQVANDWTPDQWLENVVEISATSTEYNYDNNLSRWVYKPESDRQYGAAITSPDHKTFRQVSDAGFDYVLYYLDWSSTEPGDNQYDWDNLDHAVWQAWRYNLRLVVRVDRAPDWARGPGTATAPPSNPAKLGEFLQTMAARWPRQPGKPDTAQIYGYVIWNEPNLAAEWGGTAPDAADYTALLQAAYNGVKAGSASAWVISAGLASTGDDPPNAVDDRTYLQVMYTAGAGSYFDYLGANPMGFAYTPDDASDPSGLYFSRAEDWRAIMQANGDGAKGMFGTETGWLRDTPIDLGSDYNWMKVSDIDQAHYLARAYHKAHCEWDWMGPMVTWNLDFATGDYLDTEHPYWFGVTDAGRNPLRSYLTLQNAATRGPADLWLRMELIDPIVRGQDFRYVIHYSNIGGQTATGITMTDTLPARTAYVNDTRGGILNGSQVTWDLGDLSTCTYETITLTLHLPSDSPLSGQLTNLAVAGSVAGEPYIDDNVAELTTSYAVPNLRRIYLPLLSR